MSERQGPGKPKIPAKTHNQIVLLLNQGKTPAEVKETTGVGLSTIYVIRRAPVLRPEPQEVGAPPSEQEAGPASKTA